MEKQPPFSSPSQLPCPPQHPHPQLPYGATVAERWEAAVRGFVLAFKKKEQQTAAVPAPFPLPLRISSSISTSCNPPLSGPTLRDTMLSSKHVVPVSQRNTRSRAQARGIISDASEAWRPSARTLSRLVNSTGQRTSFNFQCAVCNKLHKKCPRVRF